MKHYIKKRFIKCGTAVIGLCSIACATSLICYIIPELSKNKMLCDYKYESINALSRQQQEAVFAKQYENGEISKYTYSNNIKNIENLEINEFVQTHFTQEDLEKYEGLCKNSKTSSNYFFATSGATLGAITATLAFATMKSEEEKEIEILNSKLDKGCTAKYRKIDGYIVKNDWVL